MNNSVFLNDFLSKPHISDLFDKFEKQERKTVEGKYSDDLDPQELLKLYRETKDKNTEQGFKR